MSTILNVPPYNPLLICLRTHPNLEGLRDADAQIVTIAKHYAGQKVAVRELRVESYPYIMSATEEEMNAAMIIYALETCSSRSR